MLYVFRVRAHGSVDSSGKAVNQFTRNGNTPTGLVVRFIHCTFSLSALAQCLNKTKSVFGHVSIDEFRKNNSLGPVKEFPCISFGTEYLNCFREK